MDAKAKEALAWCPIYPGWREGFRKGFGPPPTHERKNRVRRLSAHGREGGSVSLA
jgi:hypothetical protein